MEFAIKLFLFAAVAYVLAELAYRAYRNGGLRAAFFDAPVACTLGEVAIFKGRFSRSLLRVHRLKPGSTDSVVAIELVDKGVGFEVSSFSLSEPNVMQLIALLQASLRDR